MFAEWVLAWPELRGQSLIDDDDRLILLQFFVGERSA